MLTPELEAKILLSQRNELTEHVVYKKLSAAEKNPKYAAILENISREELKHYEFFKTITRQSATPHKFKIFAYILIAKVFGLNFGLKLMERGESLAQGVYAGLKEVSPGIENLIDDENKHEHALLELIDVKHLKYISSIVLGLNDALVELTASLAGFTLALRNTRLIGIVGLITGISAAMSMAASEYLSVKHEKTEQSPFTAGIYTWFTYLAVVLLLVFPYFVFQNMFFCLGLVIAMVVLIILVFTFYTAIAKDLNFTKKFLEMVGISLVITAITFLIGLAIKRAVGVRI